MNMNKLRAWGFPVVLIVAWMVAAAYTVSFLVGPVERQSAPEGNSPEIAEPVVVAQP